MSLLASTSIAENPPLPGGSGEAGWQAKWIALPSSSQELALEGAQWIWGIQAGETVMSVAPGPCLLSRTFDAPGDITDAQFLVVADNSATVTLNGKPVAEITDWQKPKRVDVTDLLIPGANVLDVQAVNGGETPNPAGVICKLSITTTDGALIEMVSDSRWQAARDGEANTVQPATELAPWGGGPWRKEAFLENDGKGLPIFRKTFAVEGEMTRARVRVSGLGHYELFVNGRKAGDHFLAPPWSVYEKTAYYNTHDITDLLTDGKNEFRIMLGKGFYNTLGDRRVHGVFTRGQLMAILEARLEYADGRQHSIFTDDTWDVAHGPITHSAILAGEDYDANAAEPAKWWKAAVTDYAGTLRPEESPPMKMFERLSPIKPAEEPEPGFFVYNFGQNMSAIPSIQVRGRRGQTVRLTPAEQRHGQADRHNNGTGRVNQAGVGSPNYYEYTLNGEGLESWQPQFTYGGFQYVEVTGAVPKGHPNPDNLPVLEAIESVHVRSSAREVGAFACSNPLFNRIDKSIDWAVKSNLAHVLTDCPTREKLGWLEVSYLMGPSISRGYDLSELFVKVTRDIRESQLENGAIYTVAPFYPKTFGGGFRYTPEWGAAGVILPWQLYQWYGDRKVLEDNLPMMKSFVDYMKNTGTDLVPLPGLGDWFDYGHGKGSGEAKFTPPELTAMATFYRCAVVVAKTAEVLGKTEDAGRYRALAGDIRTRFNEMFYTGNGEYKNNGSPQTANAMALETGLCKPENEEAVLDAILADLEKRGYQQTAGDVGFHYLVETLGRYGCHDVIEKMLNRREVGSYGFIVDRGWTALPEAWDANTWVSMNHCMLGHAQQWFYMDVLGIRQAEDSVGFCGIVIKPAFETELEWAKGYYDSVKGRIGVEWEKKNGNLSLNVTIPADSTGVVYIPARDMTDVRANGQAVEEVPGISFVSIQDGNAVLKLDPGSYSLRSKYEP